MTWETKYNIWSKIVTKFIARKIQIMKNNLKTFGTMIKWISTKKSSNDSDWSPLEIMMQKRNFDSNQLFIIFVHSSLFKFLQVNIEIQLWLLVY
jgi:hypothetical protein